MNKLLEDRILSQASWTFRECVGLASEFNLKPRYVIGFVLALGREYIDREPADPDAGTGNAGEQS